MWTDTRKIPKAQVGGASARGCCSSGKIIFFWPNRYLQTLFEFDDEVHMRCLPGAPICNFDVQQRDKDTKCALEANLTVLAVMSTLK